MKGTNLTHLLINFPIKILGLFAESPFVFKMATCEKENAVKVIKKVPNGTFLIGDLVW